MSEISQLQINGTTYDICDAVARDSISSAPISHAYTDSTDIATVITMSNSWTCSGIYFSV